MAKVAAARVTGRDFAEGGAYGMEEKHSME